MTVGAELMPSGEVLPVSVEIQTSGHVATMRFVPRTYTLLVPIDATEADLARIRAALGSANP